ncbi:MAG: VanZ family protein [Moraxellaceae bacterium]|nr:MAG: VanZ family protein [Moraxellaceae bacterium]
MKKLYFAHRSVGLFITIGMCMLGIGLPLLWDLPGHWRLVGALQNTGHTVLFFVMGVCLVGCGLRWYWAVISLLGVGISIEIIQYFIGKDCDVHDVLLDFIGSVSAVGFLHGLKSRSLKYCVLFLTLAATAFYIPALIAFSYFSQWRNFPTLTNFDELGRSYLIDHHEGSWFELTHLPLHLRGQGNANESRVLYMGCPPERWPGVRLVDLTADWRGFSRLSLDVWLHDNAPITLGIALRGLDNQSDHHDISQRFAVQPGFNRLQWPLIDIARRAPSGEALLGKIGEIILFCMPEPARTANSALSFDNLRLEP